MYSPPSDLDPQISTMIRVKAAKLSRSPGFRRGDQEDLRQVLTLHVVERMRRHDPGRSSPQTYASRVLKSTGIDLFRRANAKRRDIEREERLDDLPFKVLDELNDGTVETDDRRDRRIDVTNAVAALPDDDRCIALALSEHSIAEVARRTRLSRQSVRTCRTRIRRHLEQWGWAGEK